MRRVMRLVMCALSVSAFAPRALADDLDVLRGAIPVAPATFTRWSGFYVGGQFGYSDALADFGNSTQTPIAYALREPPSKMSSPSPSGRYSARPDQGGITFGGFVGYNTQWQDLILGVEGNYNHASIDTGRFKLEDRAAHHRGGQPGLHTRGHDQRQRLDGRIRLRLVTCEGRASSSAISCPTASRDWPSARPIRTSRPTCRTSNVRPAPRYRVAIFHSMPAPERARLSPTALWRAAASTLR